MTVLFEDALQQEFRTSTRLELIAYCAELAVDLDGINTDSCELSVLKNKLFEAVGSDRRVATGNVESDTPRLRVRSRSVVTPPVNLSPFGKWGGRRRRITLPRPQNTLARAESFEWNGKAPYWLPYGEAVDVPWPIYCMIRDNRVKRVVQIKKPTASGANEITTGFEFDPPSFADHGTTPGTEHLPTSLADYYRGLGLKVLGELSHRDLQNLCQKIDINPTGPDRKPRPAEELLDDVCTYLYGYPYESLVDEEQAPADATEE